MFGMAMFVVLVLEFKIPKIAAFSILALSFIIPIAIFLLKKGSIKKKGTAVLDENAIVLNLHSGEQTIKFEKIESYKILRYQGVFITLRVTDGSVFKLDANENFCNSALCNEFSYDLERAIEVFRKHHGSKAVRKKTTFEQWWMLPFLIVGTVVVAGIICLSLLMRKNFPVYMIAPLVTIIPLWRGYLRTKRRQE